MKKSGRALEVPDFAGAATTGMSGRNLGALARAICTQADKQGGTASDETWRDVIGRVKGVKLGGDRWENLILGVPTLNQLKTVSRSLMSLESLRSQGVPLPKGALLYGPPGTGKTQIAKTLANESGLPIIAPITSDLKGAYTGHSAQKTREVFERARGVAPCILFIDEIDAVCPSRGGGGGGDSFTEEIVNQILQETEGANATSQGVYLLGATNRLETVDSAIRSRLKTTIEIPLPDEDQRREMMKVFLRKDKLKVDFDIDAAAEPRGWAAARCSGCSNGPRSIRSTAPSRPVRRTTSCSRSRTCGPNCNPPADSPGRRRCARSGIRSCSSPR
jgi:transitional endoplasmic reticulum ATPase